MNIYNNAYKAFLILLGLGIGIIATYLAHSARPDPELPSLDSIDSIWITMFENYNGGWYADIPESPIPADLINDVLWWFKDSTAFQGKPDTSEATIGRMKIKTKEGRIITVTIYGWGKNPILFSTNQKDFFYGHPVTYKDLNGPYHFGKYIESILNLQGAKTIRPDAK